MSYTDNPVADFERHDAEQQAWLDKLPKCCWCDKPIQDEYLFDIKGDLYCEGCMEERFKNPTDRYMKETRKWRM